MRLRRVQCVIVGAIMLLVGQAAPALSVTEFAVQCSTKDFNGDPRLGPRDLPDWGSVGLELRTYDRFGGLTPEQFLAAFWDDAQGGWRYPPANGFLMGPDGQPVQAVMSLTAGSRVDRYGSVFGAFLAPTGSPYSQRAIPPQSLDNTSDAGGCNYSAYRVVRTFSVQGGPIAPAFGQPGKGLQYLLVGALVTGAPERLNIRWLLDNGYLRGCTLVPSQPFAC